MSFLKAIGKSLRKRSRSPQPPNSEQSEDKPKKSSEKPKKSDKKKNTGEKKLVDMVFVCDTTASMSGAIQSCQTHLKSVAEQLRTTFDLRVAAIEYKDHCDFKTGEPPIGVSDFSSDIQKVKVDIDKWEATGGGDEPEALADAVNAVTNLKFRENATKIVILCADAPPHGIGCAGDEYPNGCPNEYDPLAICHSLADDGVIIYTVGVNNPSPSTVAFLCAISVASGGRYIPLASAASLPTILVGGAQEEAALQDFQDEMAREQDAVLTEAAKNGETLKEDEVFRRVAQRMEARGVVSQQLQVESYGGGAEWDAVVGGLGGARTMDGYRAMALTSAPVITSCAPSSRAGGYDDGGGWGGPAWDGSASSYGGYGGGPPGGFGGGPPGGFGGGPPSGFGGGPPGGEPMNSFAPAASSYSGPPPELRGGGGYGAASMQSVEVSSAPISYEQVKRSLARKK